jgi:uncharacterized protein (DUF302 family)
MSYYMSITMNGDLSSVEEQVREALKEEGFGVLTEIDVQATMKKKMEADMQPYKILGACHPPSAYKAIQAEDKIGTMLPCNVILQEKEGKVEVSAVDPIASMQAIENDQLGGVATDVRDRLKKVLEHLEQVEA